MPNEHTIAADFTVGLRWVTFPEPVSIAAFKSSFGGDAVVQDVDGAMVNADRVFGYVRVIVPEDAKGPLPALGIGEPLTDEAKHRYAAAIVNAVFGLEIHEARITKFGASS
jgi:hypothetical protein